MHSSRKCALVLFGICAGGVLPVHAAGSESRRVTGRIVDFLARPVEGATIILYEEAGRRPAGRRIFHELTRTESLPDGRFTLTAEHSEDIYPRKWWLIAHKNGLAMN